MLYQQHSNTHSLTHSLHIHNITIHIQLSFIVAVVVFVSFERTFPKRYVRTLYVFIDYNNMYTIKTVDNVFEALVSSSC